jgi:hypothetical protein
MRKRIIYKNTYILKLLLNVVSAGTGALVSRYKFVYAFVKESAACKINHVLTSSINSSLMLKLCDPNQYFR